MEEQNETNKQQLQKVEKKALQQLSFVRVSFRFSAAANLSVSKQEVINRA